MRIIFFGTDGLGAACLMRLAAEHEVVATVVERSAGALCETAKAAVSLENPGLRVSPRDLNSTEFARWLAALRPDVCVVAGFRALIGAELLGIPKYGFIGAHPSLLPRYRGPEPIARALLAGDATTGVTVFQLEHERDSGPIFESAIVAISPGDVTSSVRRRLGPIAASLLWRTLVRLRHAHEGWGPPTPQPHVGSSSAPELTLEDGEIRWSSSTDAILRRIAIVSPTFDAYTRAGGRMIKIHRAAATPGVWTSATGAILGCRASALIVQAAGGRVHVHEIEAESGARVTGAAWARGPGATVDRLGM